MLGREKSSYEDQPFQRKEPLAHFLLTPINKRYHVIVPDAAFDAFKANAKWAKFNLVKASEAGVENIEIDNNAPAVYYNLQGVKVANPENGVFIKVQGNKTSKVLVK